MLNNDLEKLIFYHMKYFDKLIIFFFINCHIVK